MGNDANKYISLHVKDEYIQDVLSEEKTVAAQAVIDEDEVFDLVNKLRNAGAKDILVVPIERIIWLLNKRVD